MDDIDGFLYSYLFCYLQLCLGIFTHPLFPYIDHLFEMLIHVFTFTIDNVFDGIWRLCPGFPSVYLRVCFHCIPRGSYGTNG